MTARPAPIRVTVIDCPPEQTIVAPSFCTGTIAVTVPDSSGDARSTNACPLNARPSPARVTTTGTRRRTSHDPSKLPSPTGGP